MAKDGKPQVSGGKVVVVFLVTLLWLWACSSVAQAAGSNQLAFIRGDNLWLAHSDGANARQLTTSGVAVSPALSRDGQWVAWVAYADSEQKKGAIHLAPTGGGSGKTLKMPPIAEAWSPAFTPDGQKLALVTRFNIRTRTVEGEKQEYATHAVSLVDLHTGQVRHVVKTPNHFMEAGELYTGLAVSPDGKFIAYQESGTDVSGGFVVLNLEGKRLLRYPRNPEDYKPYWRPSFSPDGSQMLCFSMATTEGEKTFIYLVDLKTLEARRLAEGYYPTFVDGGQAIVFERWTETGLTGRDATKIDLWRLDLTPGAEPRLILENAEKPAGQG
jgi:TolB protein